MVAATQPGCLLLDMPKFEPPPVTRPLLLATDAFPDLAGLTRVEQGGSLEVRADFISEDGGQPVLVDMLIDYGTPNVFGFPYRFFVAEHTRPPGTLADGPRTTDPFKWFPSESPAAAGEPGCHTVTLIASHAFDDTRCPRDLADSSQLTWIVEVCATGGVCPTTCNPAVQAGCVSFACPEPVAACPSGTGGAGGGGL